MRSSTRHSHEESRGGSVALSARHEVRRSVSRGTLLRHRNAMSQRVSKTSENRRNRIPTQCVAGDEGLRNRGRRRGKECVIDAVSTTSDDPERSLGPEPNTTFKVGLSSEHTPFSTELPCVPSKASEREVYRWNKRPSKGTDSDTKRRVVRQRSEIYAYRMIRANPKNGVDRLV